MADLNHALHIKSLNLNNFRAIGRIKILTLKTINFYVDCKCRIGFCVLKRFKSNITGNQKIFQVKILKDKTLTVSNRQREQTTSLGCLYS